MLNCRNFPKKFPCDIQSLEICSLRDRNSQKWVSGRIARPRPSLETPSLPKTFSFWWYWCLQSFCWF